MQAVVTHPVIENVPVILETPTENGKSFEWNINRVKELRNVR
jgi:deoxyribonuclease-4